MSNPNLMAGYDVTVRGTYQSASGKDRILKVFGPVTFFLPEYVDIPNGKKRVNKTVDGKILQTWEPQTAKRAVTVDNVALYVVQRRLLPTWLAENHPDAVSFRTCAITPGGMKRVMRPASDAITLDKPIAQMSLQELKAYCKMKQIAVPIAAFTDVAEARQAVQMELDSQGAAAPASREVNGQLDTNSAAPTGVQEYSGAVSSADNVPTDEEDPAAGLI